MAMCLWRNRVIDVKVYIIFQSVYFMKASWTTEFCSWTYRKLVVCSVNADFGLNVNIAKLACVVNHSLNCSDLYRPIKIVSTVGVPWRLIMYRNKKKGTGTFFTKKNFLHYSVFLNNFYLEGTGSNERKHFFPKFLSKKKDTYLFFWYKDSSKKRIKR